MKVADLFPKGRPLNPLEDNYKEQVARILAQKPVEIRVNQQANNSLYVPIPVVEELLDYLFPLGWSIEPRNTQQIANEIVGDGLLIIDCGGIKRTIWGSAGVMMQYKSKTNGGDGDVMNMSNKITNTLQKDYPHLKSEVLKSASKMLGNVFGRNLNRKKEDRTAWEGSEYVPEVDMILEDLEAITERPDLIKYFSSLPPASRQDPLVVAAFQAKTGNKLAPEAKAKPIAQAAIVTTAATQEFDL
jgi:hypothetical protein